MGSRFYEIHKKLETLMVIHKWYLIKFGQILQTKP